MTNMASDAPNTKQLLLGNEAIARGAIEAGIKVAAAYPGTPSTEIIETLSKVAKELDLYIEWSINEKVALEVAAAASLSGLRALAAMKQNGLNVALDFVGNLNLTGVNSGLVLVVCDDPGGISSTNEQDSRHIAKILDLPLLEPATAQEAKDMTKWAFELSETINNVCVLRSVTRISHARSNVIFGDMIKKNGHALFDTMRKPYASISGTTPPQYHKTLHQNLDRLKQIFESSVFNRYVGPPSPKLLIITCGSDWLYSTEALKILSADDSVGILKLGTTWPLPTNLIKKHLLNAQKVLIVEEIDAFLEGNIKELSTDIMPGMTWTFYGKTSNHINPYGELSTDVVLKAISNILNKNYISREADYLQKSQEIVKKYVFPRALQFCAGCPHRATFWALKDVLKMDGREGIIAGDIGCYSMALTPTGFSQLKTVHSMGSGVGLASGLAKLNQFGLQQPVLAVCGDSTFFHAVIPALLNGIHNRSNFILMVLDNTGTAMTGFQPHPGTDTNALGDSAPKIDIEILCRALGITVVITDPYDITGTKQKLLELLNNKGKPTVIISRRACALIASRTQAKICTVRVDPDKCVGETCGCNRYCSRVFKCPGIIWNEVTKKAEIDEAICIGCGVCATICPKSAIIRETIK